MADAEGAKRLTGLLNGIAQSSYYGNADITEELLKSELYPDLPADQFRALLEKMRGLLKSIVSADMDINQIDAFLTAQAKKQGGITTEQAAVIAKFWKNHKRKIRESVVSQSRLENNLKSMNWRIDLKSQSRHTDQENSPVAIVEMEIGKNDKESEFVYLEFNEAKINRMLKQLAEVEDSISALTQS
ncbi:copper metabolism domain containing 1 L homeolog [Xenopus laevis]|uniref:COMM domain-containing protein 1 n=1 Tax=Xenopus laevis TaxID=8355 RepID=Q4V846_XENLA|nr:copper metabolism domain containing 1 L homeolog [Xenopus laevis]AAH97550.1 MGC114682 protein [Xenopus laevis]